MTSERTPSDMLTPDEVDARINAWHNGAGQDQEIYEYLGWTREQYLLWVETWEIPDV